MNPMVEKWNVKGQEKSGDQMPKAIENYFSLKLENSYYIKQFPGRKSNGNSAPLSV